jgi:hypothetical protein
MKMGPVSSSSVIPAKAGIQGCRAPAVTLDPRFRGGDDNRSERTRLFRTGERQS